MQRAGVRHRARRSVRTHDTPGRQGHRVRRRRHPGPRGPRGGPAPAGHVHRLDRRARPASPRLGGRRQLHRRGHGRPCPSHRGHASSPMAACATSTTAAASPWASTSRPGKRRARGRAHRAARRRQVRRRRLQGVGRPPRRGRLRGQRALRVAACRDRHATARSGPRSTSAASPAGPCVLVGPSKGRHGTDTVFMPDVQVFDSIEFSFDTIAQRLRESAYLTKGVHILLVDERAAPWRERSFHFEGGIVSFVRHLNKDKDTLTAPHRHRAAGRLDLHRGRASSTTTPSQRRSLPLLTISTRSTAARTSRASARPHQLPQRLGTRQGIIKDSKDNLSGDDVREGLTAVISVKLTEPQFEGQTKAKLGNAEVKGAGPDGRLRGPQPVPRREPR